MRAPVVAGVGGGVGTTTVAVGLRGLDGGRMAGLRPGTWPDILVCRGTVDSIRRAAAVLDKAGPEPPLVLAVTLARRAPRGALGARLKLLAADAAGLVLLPHVRRWDTLVDPLAEAAQLLVEPAARLPWSLRAYAAALRELVAAVAESGRLSSDTGRDLGGKSAPRHPAVGHPDSPHRDSPDPGARHLCRPGPAPHPDERPIRRTGRDEGTARRDGGGVGSPVAGPTLGSPVARPRPWVADPFRPVGGPASRGPDPVGLLSAAPHPGRAPAPPSTNRAEVQPTRERRRGVRIVAPAEAQPAGGRDPNTELDAATVTQRAGAPAASKRVEQVG